MNIIPKDKYDLTSVSNLQSISNDELKSYLSELLEWLQDLNWPVALPISKRLSQSGKEIVKPLLSILQSEDAIWKYNILTALISQLSKEVRKELMEEIVRIINNPSKSERLEEVDLAAKDIMVMYSHDI